MRCGVVPTRLCFFTRLFFFTRLCSKRELAHLIHELARADALYHSRAPLTGGEGAYSRNAHH
eukprot:760461-Pyramimonas_sp.AAC.1